MNLPYGWGFEKQVFETMGGPREHSVVVRLDVCPEEYLIDEVAPSNWREHHKAVTQEEAGGPRVTQNEVKRFLKSRPSWGEIQRSALLGVHVISGLKKADMACRKGHALSKGETPRACRRCATERARRYRATRR